MIVAAHAQRTVLLPGVHHDHDRRQSAIHRQAHTTGGRNGASRSSDGRLDIKLLSLGAPGNGTNPEQMFAAGWSACFMGAMGVAAAKMKTRLPADAAIDAEVDLCDAGGEFFLQARLNVSLPGWSAKSTKPWSTPRIRPVPIPRPHAGKSTSRSTWCETDELTNPHSRNNECRRY